MAAAWTTLLLGAVGPVADLTAQDAQVGQPGFRVIGHAFLALRVRDDSALSVWYQRVLGLTEVRHMVARGGRVSIRILVGAGLGIELIRDESAAEPPNAHLGLFKAGFHVDDIEAAFAWLRGLGVRTDQQIVTDPAVHARTFVFRDPDGNRLQLFEACAGSC